MALEFGDILLRLSASVAAGMAIGLNRDLTNKPIGMRTLALVALGTSAVTVATVDFKGLAEHPDALSRVIQGVIQGLMTGISFIGAGVILRDAGKRLVEGLTTAATVWVAAALGIACGLGAWVVLSTALILALIVLAGVGWAESKFWPGKD
ncbi:MAG TPA: MgtC/SapB family protein [Xanthobacteraceae bacterium]|nr:MgtC/SapB family protein [Xanthobacteraceae bacterium]